MTNAFNALEAKEAITNTVFDLVLTDIRLPDSDGLGILKSVKETAFETPVILMTSYTDIKTAVNAMKIGAYDYVEKPINPDEILHTIQQALKRTDEKPKVASEKNLLKNHHPKTFHLCKASVLMLISWMNTSVLLRQQICRY
jgi:two-component system response regulator HydG